MQALVFSPPFERTGGGGAVAPTTATQSGSSLATAGAPHLSTITLDQPADQTYTITWTRSDGGAGPATSTITAGQTSVSATSTWSAAGSGRTVDFTISPSLTRSGRPLAVNVAAPGALPALTLLTAGAGTYPWTAGHAFRPGDVPSGAPLAGLQINVKSTWPDGSAKIALVSGVATATGATHSVALGTGLHINTAWLTLAQLRATGISAVIGTDAYGSATWAADSADWEAPFMVWAEGPVMSSWIFRKPIGSDTHLTAWMEVRFYSTGDVEVVPWIENGYLSVASPTAKAGTYTFTLGGTQRFSQSMPVQHHTRMPLISGSLLSHWLSADKSVVPKHDAAYLASTGLVSKYLSDVERSEVPAFPATGGVPVSFTPYEQLTATNTNFSTSMGSGGGHPSIGIQPGWEAVALTVSSARAHEQMVRESYRFGQYHTHYRDEATNRPIRFSQHGDKRLSITGYEKTGVLYVEGTGASTVLPYPAADADTNQWQQWAPSHQPAAPLLAYITTGRFWFMEECQHIACLNFLALPSYRNGSDGIVRPTAQMRQAAWVIRNLFIAACVTPDDDALKPDLDTAVQKNIEFFHAANITTPGNPFGITETQTRSAGDWGGAQAWQVDFWTAAWGRCISMRLGATQAVRQKARAFFDWAAQSIVGRLGDPTSTTAWSYRDLSAFIDASDATGGLSARVPFMWPGSGISIATDGTNTVTGTYPDYATGAGPWWSNWGAAYDHMMTTQAGQVRSGGDGSSIRGSFNSDIHGNLWNSFQAMAAAASLGVSGAVAGVARVRGASNWNSIKAFAVGDIPTNAVDYVALPAEDFSDFLPAVGARQNINVNSASEVDYDLALGASITSGKRWWNGYGGVPESRAFSSMVTSYSGGVAAPEYGIAGAMIVNGGGHGGQIGAFSYLFDFAARAWKQVGARRNLPANLHWAGYPNDADQTIYTLASDQRPVYWYDHDWNGSKIKFADHVYLQNAYVSEAEGGGKNGSVWLPLATWQQEVSATDPRTPGGYQSQAPHQMNLGDGKMIRASAASVYNYLSYGNSITVRDTTRHKLWLFSHASPVAEYYDLTSGPPYTRGTHSIQKASGGDTDTFTAVYNAVWLYVPEADAIVQFIPVTNPGGAGAEILIRVLTMSTGVPIDQQRTTLPKQAVTHGGIYIGAAWSPALGKFYLYEGLGDTFCYVLTPSSLDFATATFTWARESFSGSPPVVRPAAVGRTYHDQETAVMGRWQWVPAYGCFALHDGPRPSGVCWDGVTRDGIVQLWRPPGTPI